MLEGFIRDLAYNITGKPFDSPPKKLSMNPVKLAEMYSFLLLNGIGKSILPEKSNTGELDYLIYDSLLKIEDIFRNSPSLKVEKGTTLKDLLTPEQRKYASLIYGNYLKANKIKPKPSDAPFSLKWGTTIQIPTQQDFQEIDRIIEIIKKAQEIKNNNQNILSQSSQSLQKLKESSPDIFPKRPIFPGISEYGRSIIANHEAGFKQPALFREMKGKDIGSEAICAHMVTQADIQSGGFENRSPEELRILESTKSNNAWDLTRRFSEEAGYKSLNNFNPNDFFDKSKITLETGIVKDGMESRYRQELKRFISSDIVPGSKIGFYYLGSSSKVKVLESNNGKQNLHPNTHIGIVLGKGEISYTLADMPKVVGDHVKIPEKGTKAEVSPEELERQSKLKDISQQISKIDPDELYKKVFTDKTAIENSKKFDSQIDSILEKQDKSKKNPLTKSQVLKAFSSLNADSILDLFLKKGIDITRQTVLGLIGLFKIKLQFLNISKSGSTTIQNANFTYIPETISTSKEVLGPIRLINRQIGDFYKKREDFLSISPENSPEEYAKKFNEVWGLLNAINGLFSSLPSLLETQIAQLHKKEKEKSEYISKLKIRPGNDQDQKYVASLTRDLDNVRSNISYLENISGKSNKALKITGPIDLKGIEVSPELKAQIDKYNGLLSEKQKLESKSPPSQSKDIIDTIVDLAQARADVSKSYEPEIRKKISDNLRFFGDKIDIFLLRPDGTRTKIDIVKEFDKSSKERTKMGTEDRLILSGVMVADGLHFYTSKVHELRYTIQNRPRFLWEHLLHGRFQVTEILQPTNFKEGDNSVKYSFSLSKGEEFGNVLRANIPLYEKEAFKGLEPGSAEYQKKVEYFYSLQIKEYQLRGWFDPKMNFRLGVGGINQTLYYFDTTKTSERYSKYVRQENAKLSRFPEKESQNGDKNKEKTIDPVFFDLLRSKDYISFSAGYGDSIGAIYTRFLQEIDHKLLSFSTSSKLESLSRDLKAQDTTSLNRKYRQEEIDKLKKQEIEFRDKYRNIGLIKTMTAFQKEQLIDFILSNSNPKMSPSDIKKRKVNSGTTFAITYEQLDKYIYGSIFASGVPISLDLLKPDDKTIISRFSSNPSIQRSLAISLTAESYVSAGSSGFRNNGKSFLEPLVSFVNEAGIHKNLSLGPYQMKLDFIRYGIDGTWLDENTLSGAFDFLDRNMDLVNSNRNLYSNPDITQDLKIVSEAKKALEEIKKLKKMKSEGKQVDDLLKNEYGKLALSLKKVSVVGGHNIVGRIIQTYLANRLQQDNQEKILGYMRQIGHEVDFSNSFAIEALTGVSFNKGVGTVFTILTESVVIRHLMQKGVKAEDIKLPQLDRKATAGIATGGFSYNTFTFGDHLNYLVKNFGSLLPKEVIELDKKILKLISDFREKFKRIENPVGPGYIYDPKRDNPDLYNKALSELNSQIRGVIFNTLSSENFKNEVGSIWPTQAELEDKTFGVREIIGGYSFKYRNLEKSPKSNKEPIMASSQDNAG